MKNLAVFSQLLVFGGVATAVASAQTQPPSIAIGSKVPALACKDVGGHELDWKNYAGRATVLFFHADGMRYSRQALNEVCTSIAAQADLVSSIVVLVITNGENDTEELDAILRKTGLTHAITVDENHERFSRFDVVAFPTIFTLNKEHIVLHIDEGYSPLLKSRVFAAVRHATGRIDAVVYRGLVAARDESKLSQADVRINRALRMARRLLANGMLEEAHRILDRVLKPDTVHAADVALLADVLLREESTDRAALWIDRLRKLDPKAVALPLLRADLAVQRGLADEALRLLDKSGAMGVRAMFLRGRALEQKGRYKEAARSYRTALRLSLGRGK